MTKSNKPATGAAVQQPGEANNAGVLIPAKPKALRQAIAQGLSGGRYTLCPKTGKPLPVGQVTEPTAEGEQS